MDTRRGECVFLFSFLPSTCGVIKRSTRHANRACNLSPRAISRIHKRRERAHNHSEDGTRDIAGLGSHATSSACSSFFLSRFSAVAFMVSVFDRKSGLHGPSLLFLIGVLEGKPKFYFETPRLHFVSPPPLVSRI